MEKHKMPASVKVYRDVYKNDVRDLKVGVVVKFAKKLQPLLDKTEISDKEAKITHGKVIPGSSCEGCVLNSVSLDRCQDYLICDNLLKIVACDENGETLV
jgi:hypothetical protein